MSNVTPKFWFEFDGRKFGGRLLTIGEQSSAHVEIERRTNGSFTDWSSSTDISSQGVAFLTQVAAYLNRAIVAWPEDLPKFDWYESDDDDMLIGVWEAYGKASKTFREHRKPKAAGEGVEGAPSAS